METYWIAHWFQRLLKKQSELGLRDDIEFEESSEGDDADVSFSSITSSLSSSDESESELDRWEKHRQRVFIADRSPFSAVFYAPNGSLLEPVIRQQMVELMEQAGIHIITVNLQVGFFLFFLSYFHAYPRSLATDISIDLICFYSFAFVSVLFFFRCLLIDGVNFCVPVA